MVWGEDILLPLLGGLICSTSTDISVAAEYGGGGTTALLMWFEREAPADPLRYEDDLGSCSVDDEILELDL